MIIVVLSPHTDDGELGAGGSIARFVEEGHEVHNIVLSVPRPELKDECEAASKVFSTETNGINLRLRNFQRRKFPENRQDILQMLYLLNGEVKPDLVLTPSTFDRHQDHQVTTQEAIRAFKHTSILGYILPWNCQTTKDDVFISFEEHHLQTKIAALAHYHSQRKLGRFYITPDFTRYQSYVNGARIQKPYAETYEAIRYVI